MAEGKWISYLRVSTDRQGASGLGLEAQRQSVADYLNGGRWKLIKEFVEVESGKKIDRPQLEAALAACRLHGAKLVIARLDRLSRDAHFLLGLDKAGVDFVAADMPNANRLTVGVMALVAEDVRKQISANTKAALQAAKARGVKLGGNRGARLYGSAPTQGRPISLPRSRPYRRAALRRYVLLQRLSTLNPFQPRVVRANGRRRRSVGCSNGFDRSKTARPKSKSSRRRFTASEFRFRQNLKPLAGIT
jgi:DNA invertase Pin-like site-specific DNA recombinase